MASALRTERLVSAGGIVFRPGADGPEVLLCGRSSDNLWALPKGTPDAGETPEETALRETREETGLAAAHAPGGPRLLHVDVHPGGRGHRHLDLRYLVHAPPEEPRPAAGESRDVRWFSLDEAVAIADDGLVGALVALRGG